MTVRATNFNGGTNGTTITEANSGGTSGDALQHVSGNPTFSNAQAHSPSLSCQFPASAFTAIGFELSTSDLYVRFYVRLAQHQAETLLNLWSGVDANGSILGGISTKANGNLDLRCGATTVDVAGAALALNQWVRIEARFSTSAGAAVWLYNDADSMTVAATASTATNLGGAVATQQLRRNTTTTAASYFDDFAVSDEGLIGPAVDSLPRPALIAATAVHRASRW